MRISNDDGDGQGMFIDILKEKRDRNEPKERDKQKGGERRGEEVMYLPMSV